MSTAPPTGTPVSSDGKCRRSITHASGRMQSHRSSEQLSELSSSSDSQMACETHMCSLPCPPSRKNREEGCEVRQTGIQSQRHVSMSSSTVRTSRILFPSWTGALTLKAKQKAPSIMQIRKRVTPFLSLELDLSQHATSHIQSSLKQKSSSKRTTLYAKWGICRISNT